MTNSFPCKFSWSNKSGWSFRYVFNFAGFNFNPKISWYHRFEYFKERSLRIHIYVDVILSIEDQQLVYDPETHSSDLDHLENQGWLIGSFRISLIEKNYENAFDCWSSDNSSSFHFNAYSIETVEILPVNSSIFTTRKTEL